MGVAAPDSRAACDPKELRGVGEQRFKRLGVVRILYPHEAVEGGADLVLD